MYWAFSGTAIAIGLTAGSLAERGFFRRRSAGGLIVSTIVAGLIITVVSALVSAPVKAFVFGGVTASGSDALVVLFRRSGNSVMVSVLKGQFLSELGDKIVATALAVFTCPVALRPDADVVSRIDGQDSEHGLTSVTPQVATPSVVAPSSKLAVYVATLLLAYSFHSLSKVVGVLAVVVLIAAAIPGEARTRLWTTYRQQARDVRDFDLRAAARIGVGRPWIQCRRPPAGLGRAGIPGRTRRGPGRGTGRWCGARAGHHAATGHRLRARADHDAARGTTARDDDRARYPRILNRRYVQIMEAQWLGAPIGPFACDSG